MKKIVYTALFLLSSAVPVLASGFRMHEFSATNTGRALAGSGVAGDDYSAIGFNPAGMVLKGTGGQVGGSLVTVRANVRGSVTNGGLHTGKEGNIRLYSFLPSVFSQYALNPDWTIGLGIYTPFGLSTTYNNDWFGHTHALTSKLETIDFAPSVAYKVNKQFSVGGSVLFERLDVRLSNDLPSSIGPFPLGGQAEIHEPRNWEPGYVVGMMYQPLDSTRFGLSYRSKIVHHLKGTTKISDSAGLMGMYYVNGKYVTHAKLTLPESVLFSFHHSFNEKFDVSATVERVMWSRFKSLDIYSATFPGGVSVTPEKWRDVWFVGLGGDYHYNEDLTFRIGAAYDESPIKGPKYRTARIPDNDRYWLSAGASYRWNNMTFDLAYTHMFLKKAPTNNYASASTLDASYHMQVNIFALQVQYDF